MKTTSTTKRNPLFFAFKWLFFIGTGAIFSGIFIAAGLYYYISPKLPSIESLREIKFQVPLRVYSADNKLISEFGEKRRFPLTFEKIPDVLVKAILASEDDRFYQHPGVDYQGILRAAALLITTGEKAQGGSTITMQVARNFFLSSEKTFLRKFNEILLALKIEQFLSKNEILELYLNKIYLGNRAYGVGAAAKVYYGQNIDKLNLAQHAMIAGLPKAPSKFNPIVNPERALLRRNYVLRRMHELDYISAQTYQSTIQEPVTALVYQQDIEIKAPYAAEMVRKRMIDQYGRKAYTEGFNVYTTIDSRLQMAANDSLRNALINYELRHGYRGAEGHIDELDASEPDEWLEALKNIRKVPLLPAGIVIETSEQSAAVYLQSGKVIWLCWRGMSWANMYIDGNRTKAAPKTTADIMRVGDIIRVQAHNDGTWMLAQVPEVSGALVSLDSKNGAIKAIIGGYDFNESKFNRATQAKRQPGSNFKPFVYSSAIDKGYTASTLINDAPVVFSDRSLEDTWRPENYSGKFFGPTRLRKALVNSRNLVSIRLLRSIGVDYAINYVQRFGFKADELPRNLSLALGSATLSPLEVARGYAIFSNGGYFVTPYLISRIENVDQKIIMRATPSTVCTNCPQPSSDDGISLLQQANLTNTDQNQPAFNIAKRVVDERNVYIMTSIMRDIIKYGTGRRAKVLNRGDIAGKTGTTNDQHDAWFSGFNGNTTTTAWVGFDNPRPLGDRESGARAALPMWIRYMRTALQNTPETPLIQPPGMVTVKIDPKTGLLANSQTPRAIFETFRIEDAPKQRAGTKASQSTDVSSESANDEVIIF